MADEKEKKVPTDPNAGGPIITVKLVPQDGAVRNNNIAKNIRTY